MIRSEHSASCDHCGERFIFVNDRGHSLEFFADRSELVDLLACLGWGILCGEHGTPEDPVVLCRYCRMVGGAE